MSTLTKIPRANITPSLSMQWGRKKETINLITKETLPHRPFLSMVYCLYGRRGTTKTTDLVYLAKSQKQINLERGVKCEVWANFNLFGTMTHPKTGETIPIADVVDGYLCERVMNYDELLTRRLMDPHTYIIIVIDEITKALPSFRGGSTHNQTFRQFLVDIRKNVCDVLCATQIIQEVDRGLARQVDLFMKPQIFQRPGVDGKRAYHSRILIWDHWGQYTGKQYNRPWPPDWSHWDWKVNLGNIHKVWRDFNSREIIPPIWMQNRDAMLVAQGLDVPDDNMPQTTQEGMGEAITIDTLKAAPFYVSARDSIIRNIMGAPKAGRNRVHGWLEEQGFALTGEGEQIIAEYRGETS